MKNEDQKKRNILRNRNEKRNGHLENIFYHTRPESINDCTGYTPVIPICAEESESYEDLMDLPAPARYKRYDENDLS